MRFCIIGAGAIGSFVAARLAAAGEEVTLVARGANRIAIRANGLHVRHPDGRDERVRNVHAARLEEAGTVDAVLITLKAYQLGEVAPRIEALCDEHTAVIPMQNGIPFWYFHAQPGEFGGRAVESVDPGGTIRDAIRASRIVGSVVYLAAERIGPGAIAHTGGDRIVIGEIDGVARERVPRLKASFERAGLASPDVADIRAEVWLKLWGNLAFNPISALARATVGEIARNPEGRALVMQMMREAAAVAAKLGIGFRMTAEERVAVAEKVVGNHKTSMLQDIEAGRPTEAEALVGSVVELGELVGVETPTIAAIYRATRMLEASMRAAARPANALAD